MEIQQWDNNIGKAIKKTRNEKGLTQKELSLKSGVHESQIKKYETGKSKPTLETIKKLSKALNVGVSDLIDFDLIDDEAKSIIRKEGEKDEYISAWSGDPKQCVMNWRFILLNEEGRKKVIEYAGDLIETGTYSNDKNK